MELSLRYMGFEGRVSCCTSALFLVPLLTSLPAVYPVSGVWSCCSPQAVLVRLPRALGPEASHPVPSVMFAPGMAELFSLNKQRREH